jgi:hypothetical protein
VGYTGRVSSYVVGSGSLVGEECGASFMSTTLATEAVTRLRPGWTSLKNSRPRSWQAGSRSLPMPDPRTGYPMAMNDLPIGSRAVTLAGVLLTVLGTVALSAPADAAVIRGGDGDDRLSGTAQADSIRTFGGHDRVFALQGPDVVSGGDGNDRLKGGPGADVINGQAGADRLVAGSDDAVDELHGGAGDDVLLLVGADRGFADSGDDTIYATDAVQATEIQCGDGDDTVVLTDPDPLVTFHDCEHVREEPAGRPRPGAAAAAGAATMHDREPVRVVSAG